MILQELVRYYERERAKPSSSIAPPGWVRRPLDYIIVLREDGTCADFQQVFTVRDGSRIGTARLLPAIGKQALKHTNSGKDSNLLWDNASFVLGLGKRGSMKLESFACTIDEWFPECVDPGVRAVRRFVESVRADQTLARKLIDRFEVGKEFEDHDPILAFRLDSDGPVAVHERDSVLKAYASGFESSTEKCTRGRCLVTGEPDVALGNNETVIKGVWKTQTSGANIVSFNAAAFVSYGGREGSRGCAPIGRVASAAYSTALNHLLESESRNKVQVGDATTVFWADRPSRFDSEFTLADFFGESRDDPQRGVRAVQALFDSLKTGQLPVAERDVEFFVLGLAPNAARISVRFWLRAPLAELGPRIARHFADLRIARRFDGDPVTPSMFRLLTSLAVQGKAENVPPRLAGEWVRAILEGQPLPALLLNAAVNRCKAEQEVSYLRAAILKAWMNRDYRRGHPGLPSDFSYIKEDLDMEQSDVPYRLGRLFAVLERIQQQAMPGINATIRDRFYGAASTTPVAVFTTLLRLKNAHLKKLADSASGYFEKLIGEIVAPLADFPRQLTLPEQGRFALGYYHQRQSFFTRKEAADPTSSEEN